MKLTTEQLARVSRLLDDVIELGDAARREWLRVLPAEHADIQTALRQGLFPGQGAVVADDALAVLDRIRAGEGGAARSGLQAGESVGPYRLLRRLGSGGMAEVWLAQRADGAFKREVALKVPVHLDRRQDLARRFAIERDILAALEHPHIARFYDAGVSQDGKPYLALEYVAGKNLLQWADEHELEIRARIELMLQVVDAVAYAHERGVLHRDIKPGNVLVTAAGQANLLDFGVAKIMEGSADADLTQVYGQALTPGYASPEQMKGESIDAASDVYSLGVVLYQLLCGRRPFAIAGGAIEVDRTIDRPSARLEVATARLRGGSVTRVARALRGDLDAIVVRALAQSPSRRYDSAAALARDLRRYLAGEPVEAIPASLTYTLAKFLTRNRVGAALAAALAVVVAGAAYEMRHWQQAATAPVAQSAPAPLAQPPAPVAPPVRAAPADKSIAVLPFSDLSEEHDQAYFSDGLSTELINRLARSPTLRVIARTSAFAFKGSNEDPRSIGAKLGVAYLLVGSVGRNGQTLRISTQLVRAADGSRAWAQTYERPLGELFKVQDEIAATVARALETILDGTRRHAAREPNVEAYNLVLQGEVYANGPFKRDAERAEVSFKKAAQLDPGYAMPWVKLGLLYMNEGYLARTPGNERNTQARQAIDKALRIEPDSIAAHAARFRYLVQVAYQWNEARAELDRMRAIDMSDALLLPDCEAYFAAVNGKLDEAINIQRQALDRDPLNASAIATLAFYLHESDRFEESLALLRREAQLNPHAIGNRSLAGVNLALSGRGEAALAEIAGERHEVHRLWAFSIAYWMLGRTDESDAALNVLIERFPQASAYSIAQLYALRDKKTAAFDWLNRACAARQSGCEMLRVDRFLRRLHDDARYRALLARMKLGDD